MKHQQPRSQWTPPAREIAVCERSERRQGHPSTLAEAIRLGLRARHLSRRTEKANAGWISGFRKFHRGHHPRDLCKPEIEDFPPDLAIPGRASASTQNQAPSAHRLLYRDVHGWAPWLGLAGTRGGKCRVYRARWTRTRRDHGHMATGKGRGREARVKEPAMNEARPISRPHAAYPRTRPVGASNATQMQEGGYRKERRMPPTEISRPTGRISRYTWTRIMRSSAAKE
jgi:hypothetical protein